MTPGSLQPQPHPASSHRWGRRILVALLLVLVLAAILPYAGILIARAWLPISFPQGQVRLITLREGGAPVACLVRLAPGSARRILSSSRPGLWIPWGVLRTGMGAIGTVRVACADADPIAVSWQVVVDGNQRQPSAQVHLSRTQVAALIRDHSRVQLGSMHLEMQLDHATVVTESQHTGTSPETVLLVHCSGALHLDLGMGMSEFPVTSMDFHLHVQYLPILNGWKPMVRITIEAVDMSPPASGLFSNPTSRSQLEQVLNARFDKSLAGKVLPPWYPPDLQLSGDITDDPTGSGG